MNKIKIGFIGGLSNGKIVFDYLNGNKHVDIVVSLTYIDRGDKPRNEVVKGDLIESNSANEFKQKFIESDLDIIIVAGWSELLEEELISCAKIGTFGFHPAVLPQDRGRSVVAWQIEDGYSKSGLTFFKYNDYPDGGDIVAIEEYRIENSDYVSDILEKIDRASYNIMKAYFPLLRKGLIEYRKQDLSVGTFRRLRNDRDSEINWNSTSQVIYNKIRAVAKPYPMAFFLLNEERYYINRSEIISFNIGENEEPGTLIATLFDDSLVFKTKDGFIRLNEVLKK
jgi:methionyl-tRNA formyltransferase